MLLGGWGGRSAELLGIAGARAGAVPERCGSLSILGATGAADDEWRYWLSGRVTNSATLLERFPGPGGVDLDDAVARAHSQLGAAAWDLLRGEFLLVTVDLVRDLAFVNRDHLGGRPLVYSRLEDGVIFAEHECEILDLLPSAPAPDRLALTQWLDGGSLPHGHTLYKGIERLPAGHRLELSGSGVEVRPHWSPRFEGTRDGSREQIAEHLREQAFAAVGRAAHGARRVSVRLSGGLDSACVAAGLAARRPRDTDALALSAVFPGQPETDERELIEATAAATGIPGESIPFDAGTSILPPALGHIESWRLPPMTPNLFVWEPLMARALSLGVDVMLDGEGGDELFGMAPFLIADRLRAGRLISAWSLTGGIPGVGRADMRMRMRALRVFGVGGLIPEKAKRWRRRREEPSPAHSVLSADDRAAIAALEHTTAEDELDGPTWWRALARELTSGREGLDVSGHLRRESLTAGIERRHPFLFDRDLVEVVLGNPPQLQFDPDRDRPLLRDALAGYIPAEVRTRNAKSDFTPIMVAALSGRDGEVLMDGLARLDAPIRAYVEERAHDRLVGSPGGPRPARAAHQLWRLGVANFWLMSLDDPDCLAEVLEKSR